MWDDVYDGLSFHGVIYNTGFYKALGYKLTEHVFYEDQEYATVLSVLITIIKKSIASSLTPIHEISYHAVCCRPMLPSELS